MKIGFSTSNSVISKIIRKLTRSEVSHTYLKHNIEGHDLVLHANEHGVEFDKYVDFNRKFTIVAEYDLIMTDAQEKAFIFYAVQQVDRPYDFLALVGFAWVLLNKAFKRKIGNPFKNKAAYFCSELMLTSLQAAKFFGSEHLDRDLTTPEDLMGFLDKHPLAKKN